MIQHLDPWPFVWAAYGVTLGGAALLALVSYWRMRRSERSGPTRSDAGE